MSKEITKKHQPFAGLSINPWGNWSTEVVLFDTRNWEDEDWQQLDEASDRERLTKAIEISDRIRTAEIQVRDMIKQSETIEVRVFLMDDDGVEEINPEGH